MRKNTFADQDSEWGSTVRDVKATEAIYQSYHVGQAYPRARNATSSNIETSHFLSSNPYVRNESIHRSACASTPLLSSCYGLIQLLKPCQSRFTGSRGVTAKENPLESLEVLK